MAQQYNDLDDLLNRSPKAKDFFDALPQERQQNIRHYKDTIQYDKDLRRYAENLLTGGFE